MAKDIFHNHVKQILINEGWTITHDPYRIDALGVKIYEIDLGAERLIADTVPDMQPVEVRQHTGYAVG